MSNASDFIIENGRLEKYVGPGGNVVIPEGVRYMSSLAFQQTCLTALSLPTTMSDVPNFIPAQKQLSSISVAEGSPYFKSVDGVLYNAEMTCLLKCPDGREGELSVPNGVTEIKFDAILGCLITVLSLPASMVNVPVFSPPEVIDITVDGGNSNFKCVDGILYDAKMETLLCYPAGRGGEFYVPGGVKCVILDSFANIKTKKYQIHIGAGIDVKMQWAELVEGNGHITIYAPVGSEAERMARRCDCVFEAEGEPVSMDDSDQRKTRSFQEWRQIFMFTAKSKGVTISKYVRGSKVVYLPDKLGKSDVAVISKTAFPPEVTVLCSQKLFTKISEENRNSTIRSFLVNRELFAEDEQSYLLTYLKKHRAEYLEHYILQEDYPALEACFAVMPKVKTLMDECLTITERYDKQQVNVFLLQIGRS